MYDVGGKLLHSTKTMYVNSLACVRVVGESECFRIDSDVRHVPLPVQCIYECRVERGANGQGEEGRVVIVWPLECR